MSGVPRVYFALKHLPRTELRHLARFLYRETVANRVFLRRGVTDVAMRHAVLVAGAFRGYAAWRAFRRSYDGRPSLTVCRSGSTRSR